MTDSNSSNIALSILGKWGWLSIKAKLALGGRTRSCRAIHANLNGSSPKADISSDDRLLFCRVVASNFRPSGDRPIVSARWLHLPIAVSFSFIRMENAVCGSEHGIESGR
jgi:hypothetical protein